MANVFPTSSAQAPRKTLGIALVGLGKYSSNQLAPALQQTKSCRLAGIVTGTSAKADEWAQKYGLPQENIYNYQNFDTIAHNPDIDIVYVVLPNSMHAEYTIRAAKAGKHVICEKPMALTVEDCHAMIDACNAADRKLSIGYRLHFEPHNQEVMRLGQQKAFGQVKILENSFGLNIGDPTQWRLKMELAGGGALQDVGIYAINAARYATGEEPISVMAQEYKTDPVKFGEVDETVAFQLTFPSGTVANCTTTYAVDTERLFGAAENGWFELRPAYSYSGIKGKTSKGEMNFPQINQQAAQMDDFADCILRNKQTRVPGELGLKDVQIIQAVYKAIETGREERIS
jgi:predicted dehydrogenase